MRRPGLKAFTRRGALVLALGWSTLAAAAPATPPVSASQRVDGASFLRIARQPAGGDLDAIRKRGFLRVLVVANKTHFLVDRGRQFGIAYEMVREFEKSLNTGFPRKQKHYIPVVFIPVHRDEILVRLKENRGDLAVANLTVTAGREAIVDFSDPFIDDVREIIVSGPGAEPLKTIDDLSGKAVFVRKSSSFHEHLVALNATLAARGLPQVRIQAADEHLEAEDLMEMVHAGLVPYTVIDEHIGNLWAQVFPAVTLHRDLAISSGQRIAWAMRKDTPQLREAVNTFLARHRTGTATGNTLYRRYLQNTRWVKNASAARELAKFERTISYFRRYAERYGFDALMLAAQGYQESGLDQARRSHVGAIGVMQLMPATGAELRVGDIRQEEANIHGGAKYMRRLVDTYFDEPGIDDFNRTLFAFAAYNAGPGRVSSLRRLTAKMGLDPNQWFHHVETVAAMKIGRETTQYVANISKYYIAYKLLEAQRGDGLRSEKE